MNNRQIMILKTLRSKSEHIAAKDLAAVYNVSTKTIYNDIDSINAFISKFNITIEKTPRKGIIINDNNKFQKLASVLNDLENSKAFDPQVEDREEYLFKELFINRHKLNITSYEDNAYISEGSARRDIKKFEKLLAKAKLSFHRENGLFSLMGNESYVRKFTKDYLHSLIDSSNFEDIETLSRFFDLKTILDCKNVIIQLGKKYNYDLSQRYFNTLLIDLLVQINMIQIGYFLEPSKNSLSFDMNHFEVFFYAREVLTQLLKTKEEIPSAEIEALSFTLLAVGFKINNIDYNTRLNKSVESLIQKVSKILDIDLSHDLHLRDMLISHIGPMIFRLQKSISVNNPVVEEVKKEYSVLYNIVWLSVRELTEAFNIKMTDDEAAFLAIHFQIAVEKIHKPMNILVICPHGIATSELLISKLKRVISDTDKIVKADYEDLDRAKLSNIDFIVSSVKLNEVSIPVFEVSPVITAQEMNLIQSFYYKSLNNNRLAKFGERSELKNNLIRELIGENILIHSKSKTMEAIYEDMTKIAHEENLNNPLFIESIKKRESMGSTGVYTGISLPHCDPKQVTKSQLGVITLEQPMLWGKNLIKVVFLIAIAEEDIESTKQILINLYRKIEYKNYIEELWKASTAEELVFTLINWREDDVRK
ncbi:BglG family transcription antiterminator [Facklamia miroungae]|uniref:Transcriptional antiterminator n=1 Tax=Facklamia miroungae TaxID=120956 RepID=A0A1G7UBR7_9LACT|nr:PTS sugar transporter subunit IIA [Facklamia miroungae]NKZ30045.1 BglG family transcription antiterminator [Facklamia miroungae]SDG44884.1 Transcriptional antiterminator [Facklamia miroungae]